MLLATLIGFAVVSCSGGEDSSQPTEPDASTTTYFHDGDSDTFGDPNDSTVVSTAEDQPSDHVSDNTDCDDSDADVNPDADEIPDDGIDNDCNGEVDEVSYWYEDADGDGYGNASADTISGSQPTGYVADNTDCDDSDASIHPGAQEAPTDGLDNDCDGEVDETSYWYEDADGDGYGNPAVDSIAESQPTGYVADDTDCDDSDPNTHPGATEMADGKDNDCDGEVDEGLGSTWYEDADGDGYGNASVDSVAVSQPAGYVSNPDDCDDSDASIHPGAQEMPTDGLDNDCDGEVDETSYWYEDADGDGYGNPAVETIAESQPTGYVADDTDCDDSDPNVNPGADEISGDGIDNDCDGQVDETS